MLFDPVKTSIFGILTGLGPDPRTQEADIRQKRYEKLKSLIEAKGDKLNDFGYIPFLTIDQNIERAIRDHRVYTDPITGEKYQESRVGDEVIRIPFTGPTRTFYVARTKSGGIKAGLARDDVKPEYSPFEARYMDKTNINPYIGNANAYDGTPGLYGVSGKKDKDLLVEVSLPYNYAAELEYGIHSDIDMIKHRLLGANIPANADKLLGPGKSEYYSSDSPLFNPNYNYGEKKSLPYVTYDTYIPDKPDYLKENIQFNNNRTSTDWDKKSTAGKMLSGLGMGVLNTLTKVGKLGVDIADIVTPDDYTNVDKAYDKARDWLQSNIDDGSINRLTGYNPEQIDNYGKKAVNAYHNKGVLGFLKEVASDPESAAIAFSSSLPEMIAMASGYGFGAIVAANVSDTIDKLERSARKAGTKVTTEELLTASALSFISTSLDRIGAKTTLGLFNTPKAIAGIAEGVTKSLSSVPNHIKNEVLRRIVTTVGKTSALGATITSRAAIEGATEGVQTILENKATDISKLNTSLTQKEIDDALAGAAVGMGAGGIGSTITSYKDVGKTALDALGTTAYTTGVGLSKAAKITGLGLSKAAEKVFNRTGDEIRAERAERQAQETNDIKTEGINNTQIEQEQFTNNINDDKTTSKAEQIVDKINDLGIGGKETRIAIENDDNITDEDKATLLEHLDDIDTKINKINSLDTSDPKFENDVNELYNSINEIVDTSGLSKYRKITSSDTDIDLTTSSGTIVGDKPKNYINDIKINIDKINLDKEVNNSKKAYLKDVASSINKKIDSLKNFEGKNFFTELGNIMDFIEEYGFNKYQVNPNVIQHDIIKTNLSREDRIENAKIDTFAYTDNARKSKTLIDKKLNEVEFEKNTIIPNIQKANTINTKLNNLKTRKDRLTNEEFDRELDEITNEIKENGFKYYTKAHTTQRKPNTNSSKSNSENKSIKFTEDIKSNIVQDKKIDKSNDNSKKEESTTEKSDRFKEESKNKPVIKESYGEKDSNTLINKSELHGVIHNILNKLIGNIAKTNKTASITVREKSEEELKNNTKYKAKELNIVPYTESKSRLANPSTKKEKFIPLLEINDRVISKFMDGSISIDEIHNISNSVSKGVSTFINRIFNKLFVANKGVIGIKGIGSIYDMINSVFDKKDPDKLSNTVVKDALSQLYSNDITNIREKLFRIAILTLTGTVDAVKARNDINKNNNVKLAEGLIVTAETLDVAQQIGKEFLNSYELKFAGAAEDIAVAYTKIGNLMITISEELGLIETKVGESFVYEEYDEEGNKLVKANHISKYNKISQENKDGIKVTNLIHVKGIEDIDSEESILSFRIIAAHQISKLLKPINYMLPTAEPDTTIYSESPLHPEHKKIIKKYNELVYSIKPVAFKFLENLKAAIDNIGSKSMDQNVNKIAYDLLGLNTSTAEIRQNSESGKAINKKHTLIDLLESLDFIKDLKNGFHFSYESAINQRIHVIQTILDYQGGKYLARQILMGGTTPSKIKTKLAKLLLFNTLADELGISKEDLLKITGKDFNSEDKTLNTIRRYMDEIDTYGTLSIESVINANGVLKTNSPFKALSLLSALCDIRNSKNGVITTDYMVENDAHASGVINTLLNLSGYEKAQEILEELGVGIPDKKNDPYLLVNNRINNDKKTRALVEPVIKVLEDLGFKRRDIAKYPIMKWIYSQSDVNNKYDMGMDIADDLIDKAIYEHNENVLTFINDLLKKDKPYVLPEIIKNAHDATYFLSAFSGEYTFNSKNKINYISRITEEERRIIGKYFEEKLGDPYVNKLKEIFSFVEEYREDMSNIFNLLSSSGKWNGTLRTAMDYLLGIAKTDPYKMSTKKQKTVVFKRLENGQNVTYKTNKRMLNSTSFNVNPQHASDAGGLLMTLKALFDESSSDDNRGIMTVHDSIHTDAEKSISTIIHYNKVIKEIALKYDYLNAALEELNDIIQKVKSEYKNPNYMSGETRIWLGLANKLYKKLSAKNEKFMKIKENYLSKIGFLNIMGDWEVGNLLANSNYESLKKENFLEESKEVLEDKDTPSQIVENIISIVKDNKLNNKQKINSIVTELGDLDIDNEHKELLNKITSLFTDQKYELKILTVKQFKDMVSSHVRDNMKIKQKLNKVLESIGWSGYDGSVIIPDDLEMKIKDIYGHVIDLNDPNKIIEVFAHEIDHAIELDYIINNLDKTPELKYLKRVINKLQRLRGDHDFSKIKSISDETKARLIYILDQNGEGDIKVAKQISEFSAIIKNEINVKNEIQTLFGNNVQKIIDTVKRVIKSAIQEFVKLENPILNIKNTFIALTLLSNNAKKARKLDNNKNALGTKISVKKEEGKVNTRVEEKNAFKAKLEPKKEVFKDDIKKVYEEIVHIINHKDVIKDLNFNQVELIISALDKLEKYLDKEHVVLLSKIKHILFNKGIYNIEFNIDKGFFATENGDIFIPDKYVEKFEESNGTIIDLTNPNALIEILAHEIEHTIHLTYIKENFKDNKAQTGELRYIQRVIEKLKELDINNLSLQAKARLEYILNQDSIVSQIAEFVAIIRNEIGVRDEILGLVSSKNNSVFTINKIIEKVRLILKNAIVRFKNAMKDGSIEKIGFTLTNTIEALEVLHYNAEEYKITNKVNGNDNTFDIFGFAKKTKSAKDIDDEIPINPLTSVNNVINKTNTLASDWLIILGDVFEKNVNPRLDELHKELKAKYPLYKNVVNLIRTGFYDSEFGQQVHYLLGIAKDTTDKPIKTALTLFNTYQQEINQKFAEMAKMDRYISKVYNKEEKVLLHRLFADTGIANLLFMPDVYNNLFNDTDIDNLMRYVTVKGKLKIKDKRTLDEVAQEWVYGNSTTNAINLTYVRNNNSDEAMVYTTLKAISLIDGGRELLVKMNKEHKQLKEDMMSLALANRDLNFIINEQHADTYFGVVNDKYSNTYDGHYSIDLYNKNFEYRVITIKDMKNVKNFTKNGWVILRSPTNDGVYGLIARESFIRRVPGVGLDVDRYINGAYLNNEQNKELLYEFISLENKEKKEWLNKNRLVLDGKRFKVLIDKKTKIEKLGLVQNAAQSLYRTFIHNSELIQLENIRKLILNEGTEYIKTVEDMEKLNDLLYENDKNGLRGKRKEVKPFISINFKSNDFKNIKSYEKLKQEYPYVAKYFKPAEGLTSFGDFNRKIYLVKKGVSNVLLGYKSTSIFGNSDYRKLAHFEDMFKKIIVLAKQKIAVVNPLKLMEDSISNLIVLFSMGIDPIEIIKGYYNGFSAYKEYARERTKYVELAIEAGLMTSRYKSGMISLKEFENVNRKRDEQLAKLKELEFYDAFEYGVIQSYGTELVTKEFDAIQGVQHDVDEFINYLTHNKDNEPNNVFRAIKWIQKIGGIGLDDLIRKISMISKIKKTSLGTELIELSARLKEKKEDKDSVARYISDFFATPASEAVSYSSTYMTLIDALSKYVLAKNLLNRINPKTKRKYSKEEAYNMANDTFIDYRVNLPIPIKTLSDYGILLFPDFWIKIQKTVFNLFKYHPITTSGYYVANSISDTENLNVVSQSILTKFNKQDMFNTPGSIISTETFIPFL